MTGAHNLTFEEIEIGSTFELTRTFSAEDIDIFAALTGDYSPLHMDAEYARESGFDNRIVHGMLMASLFSNLVGMRIPGKPALFLGEDLSFRRAVAVGETVVVRTKVNGKSAATRTIDLGCEIRNSDDKVVVSGTAKVRVREQSEISAAKPDTVATTGTTTFGCCDLPVAFICGGSRGIGADIASLLAANGMAVVVTYFSNRQRADALVADLIQQQRTAFAVECDVRSEDSVRDAITATVARFGRLDKVVNTAIGELVACPVGELTWDAFERHLATQLKGVFHVARACYPLLKESPAASMVNVLSQVVYDAPPAHMADYVSAKYALKGLSKSLASEWAADGIRVNTVSPGLTRTELTMHYHERIFKMEGTRTPLRRIATPRDVADAVLYLLGDSASFITGLDIPVTGGQLMN
jgi:3-oxoacyl-[acyl-carrier protein] reductase